MRTEREPTDAPAPVCLLHLRGRSHRLSAGAPDAGRDLQKDRQVRDRQVYRQTHAGVHTSAESVCQRSRLVQLISQEAAVRRAAYRCSQLLETGSDLTQSFLSALALSLLPLPQGQLIHGTSPTIHDVITHPLVLRQKGRALRDEKDIGKQIFKNLFIFCKGPTFCHIPSTSASSR